MVDKIKQKSLDELIDNPMKRGEIRSILLDFPEEEITQYAISLIEREEFELLRNLYVASVLKLPKELLKSKFDELAEQSRFNDIDTLELAVNRKMRRTKEYTQNRYEAFLEEGSGYLAKRLRENTRFELTHDEELMQKCYMALFTGKSSPSRIVKGVIDFFKETGVKPEVDKGLVQQLYLRLIKSYDIEELSKLHDLTGVKVKVEDRKSLQEAYEHLIETWYVKDAVLLEELTGVKISSHSIREGLRFDSGFHHNLTTAQFEALKPICRRSNINLNDIIQDYYREELNEGNTYDVKAVMLRTGTRPRVSSIQSAYSKLVRKGEIKDVKRMRKLFRGIEPKLGARTVQQGYSVLLSEDKFDDIKYLKKLTGIELSSKSVQAAYKKYIFEDKKYDNAFALYKITKEKPVVSDKAMHEVYLQLFTHGDSEYIKKLVRLTGVKLTKDIIRESYKNANYGTMYRMAKATGIKPTDEIIIKHFKDMIGSGSTTLAKIIYKGNKKLLDKAFTSTGLIMKSLEVRRRR